MTAAQRRQEWRAHRGLWPRLDLFAHWLHVGGPLGRYLCDRADRAFGLYDDESRG